MISSESFANRGSISQTKRPVCTEIRPDFALGHGVCLGSGDGLDLCLLQRPRVVQLGAAYSLVREVPSHRKSFFFCRTPGADVVLGSFGHVYSLRNRIRGYVTQLTQVDPGEA